MQILQLARNKTLVRLGNGNEILYSYKTPVAMKKDGQYYRTERFYSATTTRHINSSDCYRKATPVAQAEIDEFAKEQN